jgi:hypothetical protein
LRFGLLNFSFRLLLLWLLYLRLRLCRLRSVNLNSRLLTFWLFRVVFIDETFGLTSLAFAGAMITISAAVVTAVPIIFGGCLPPTATKAGCFIAIAAA